MRNEIKKPYRLLLGDCLKRMGKLSDNSVDVIITDPPYGLGFPYNSYNDTRENLRNLIRDFFPIARSVAKKRIVILCGPTQINEYPVPDWIGIVTWNTTGSFGNYGYSQWTPILLYGKDRKGFGSVNGILKSDCISISGGGGVGFQRSVEEKKHTCPKPLTIMNPCVRRYSEPGDIVLDPFMGIGTTGVSCVKTGREFIGIEIDKYYFELSRKRIEHAYKHKGFFTI